MYRSVFGIVLFLMVSCGTADWTTTSHDLQRTNFIPKGSASESVLMSSPYQTARLNNVKYLYDGDIYQCGRCLIHYQVDPSAIRCVDYQSLQVIWSNTAFTPYNNDTGPWYSWSPPMCARAASGALSLFLFAEHQLITISLESGNTVNTWYWAENKFWTLGNGGTTVVLDGGVVLTLGSYHPSYNGMLIALDPNTNSTLWTTKFTNSQNSYVGQLVNGYMFCLNKAQTKVYITVAAGSDNSKYAALAEVDVANGNITWYQGFQTSYNTFLKTSYFEGHVIIDGGYDTNICRVGGSCVSTKMVHLAHTPGGQMLFRNSSSVDYTTYSNLALASYSDAGNSLNIIWQTPSGTSNKYSLATIDENGVVFVSGFMSGATALWAFDLTSGAEIWHLKTNIPHDNRVGGLLSFRTSSSTSAPVLYTQADDAIYQYGCCNGHGSCSKAGACACEADHYAFDCGTYCLRSTTCSNKGNCGAADGQCQCDSNYYTADCSVFCERGSDCSGHGSCTNDGTCSCDNSFVMYYTGTNCGDRHVGTLFIVVVAVGAAIVVAGLIMAVVFVIRKRKHAYQLI